MHLRAAFKAGRWDDVMIGVLTDTFQTPSFASVSTTATHQSAEAQECDTPQTSLSPESRQHKLPPFYQYALYDLREAPTPDVPNFVLQFVRQGD